MSYQQQILGAIYDAIDAQVRSAYAGGMRVVNGVLLFYRVSRFADQPRETSALQPAATPRLEPATAKETLRLCTTKPTLARTKLRS